MNQPPQPSTYGQIKTFLKTLYEELLQAGYEQPDLYGMSLSNALLARYGSSEAVDQAIGEGTFKGVKQVHGGLSAWRHPWTRVRQAQKARYLAQLKALEALSAAADQCRALGIPEQDIQRRLHKPLTSASIMPLKAAPKQSSALMVTAM